MRTRCKMPQGGWESANFCDSGAAKKRPAGAIKPRLSPTRWKHWWRQFFWTQAWTPRESCFAECYLNTHSRVAEYISRIRIASQHCRNFCKGEGGLRRSTAWLGKKDRIIRRYFTSRSGRWANAWRAATATQKRKRNK